MLVNKFEITDIKTYDFTKYGGTITLKFNNGVTTKRNFSNVRNDFECKCSLSGEVIPTSETCLRVTIKKQGYGRYYLKNDTVSKAIKGEFKVVDEKAPLVVELRKFLNTCADEKVLMDKQDRQLREALREIKFKKSKIGVQMSKANQLLEVLE